MHGRKRYDGQVFVAFLGLYAAGRFALEYLRADDRGRFLTLSTSQLFGLGMIGVAIAIHVRRSRKSSPPSIPGPKTTGPTSAEPLPS